MDDLTPALPASALAVSIAVALVGAVIFGYGVVWWALSNYSPILVGGAMMIAGAATGVGVLAVSLAVFGNGEGVV